MSDRVPMTGARFNELAPPARLLIWGVTVGLCLLFVGVPVALIVQIAS
jgi:hypothetical protein